MTAPSESLKIVRAYATRWVRTFGLRGCTTEHCGLRWNLRVTPGRNQAELAHVEYTAVGPRGGLRYTGDFAVYPRATAKGVVRSMNVTPEAVVYELDSGDTLVCPTGRGVLNALPGDTVVALGVRNDTLVFTQRIRVVYRG